MRAVTFPEPGRIEVADAPEPVCGDLDVVVRVRRAGLCGTDLHIFRNEYLSDFPLVPGHEFVGDVVEVGRRVSHLAVGDRVAVDPNVDCLHCAFCRRQENNHCLNWQGVGITRPGAFAERVAAPARLAYRVPEEIDDASAAFIEPLSCVVYALSRLPVKPGDDVLVFGSGPIGLLLIRLLARRGCGAVVVVEKQAARRELALRYGAAEALPPEATDNERLRELSPHGFAVVVDATGVPAVIERALAWVRPRGHFLQFGVAPREASVKLRPFDLFKRDLTILGSFALCYTFEPAIALLASGAVDVRPLVTHTLPLDDFASGFDAFARGEAMKVQFAP